MAVEARESEGKELAWIAVQIWKSKYLSRTEKCVILYQLSGFQLNLSSCSESLICTKKKKKVQKQENKLLAKKLELCLSCIGKIHWIFEIIF